MHAEFNYGRGLGCVPSKVSRLSNVEAFTEKDSAQHSALIESHTVSKTAETIHTMVARCESVIGQTRRHKFPVSGFSKTVVGSHQVRQLHCRTRINRLQDHWKGRCAATAAHWTDWGSRSTWQPRSVESRSTQTERT